MVLNKYLLNENDGLKFSTIPNKTKKEHPEKETKISWKLKYDIATKIY